MSFRTFPKKQGLYDPAYEKDSCGVGFVANMKGVPDHQIVLDALWPQDNSPVTRNEPQAER